MPTVYGAQHAAEHRDWWKHPLIAATLSPSTYDRFAGLMGDAEGLLSVLEALPVSLAHHDAQWRNLFQLKEPIRLGRRLAPLRLIGRSLGWHRWGPTWVT